MDGPQWAGRSIRARVTRQRVGRFLLAVTPFTIACLLAVLFFILAGLMLPRAAWYWFAAASLVVAWMVRP